MNNTLEQALRYHEEGLCVIPVVSKEKRPALKTWEEYQSRISTRREVTDWFSNGGHVMNIGLVHCQLKNGLFYVAIDIDHDQGISDAMRAEHPYLFTGRIEQSGGGEGIHIPLLIDKLPDFGWNEKFNRPKGTRTWKLEGGHVNPRIAYHQTVAPYSTHPSGGVYTFTQEGPITHIQSLSSLVTWLNELAPIPTRKAVTRRAVPAQIGDAANLLDAVKAAWPEAISVFSHFGLVGETRRERNNEIRLLGNGGLLVADDGETWYNFSAEEGGGIIEAWAWCRFGSVASKQGRFRSILLEMAQAAGVDVARFHRRGDERTAVEDTGDRQRWTRERGAGAWGRMR